MLDGFEGQRYSYVITTTPILGFGLVRRGGRGTCLLMPRRALAADMEMFSGPVNTTWQGIFFLGGVGGKRYAEYAASSLLIFTIPHGLRRAVSAKNNAKWIIRGGVLTPTMRLINNCLIKIVFNR
jgi:hypothetical protein